jgi:hypothetical protein
MSQLQPSKVVLCLSDRHSNSNGRRNIVVCDNPATRALVLQAIEEQVEQTLNCEINMKFTN